MQHKSSINIKLGGGADLHLHKFSCCIFAMKIFTNNQQKGNQERCYFRAVLIHLYVKDYFLMKSQRQKANFLNSNIAYSDFSRTASYYQQKFGLKETEGFWSLVLVLEHINGMTMIVHSLPYFPLFFDLLSLLSLFTDCRSFGFSVAASLPP